MFSSRFNVSEFKISGYATLNLKPETFNPEYSTKSEIFEIGVRPYRRINGKYARGASMACKEITTSVIELAGNVAVKPPALIA